MKEAFYTCSSTEAFATSIKSVEFEKTENGCLTKNWEFVQSVSRFLDYHDSLVWKFQLTFCPVEWCSSLALFGCEEWYLRARTYVRWQIICNSCIYFAAGTSKVLKTKMLYCSSTIYHLPSITGFRSLKLLLPGTMFIFHHTISSLCFHCESLQYVTLKN